MKGVILCIIKVSNVSLLPGIIDGVMDYVIFMHVLSIRNLQFDNDFPLRSSRWTVQYSLTPKGTKIEASFFRV